MDKYNKPIFDGQSPVSLEKTLEYVTQNLERELGGLEKSIINLLYNSYINNSDRFVTDEDNILLVRETNESAGIVELTEDYSCVFKTEPVHVSSPKNIAEKIARAGGKIYQELFVHGAQPVASLLSFSSGMPDNASVQADLQNAIRSIASYSNKYGIPMVGGDTCFNDSTQRGMTTDVLSVGIIDKDAQLSQACTGEGNLVFMLGSSVADEQDLPVAFAARTVYEMICDLHDEKLIIAVQSVGPKGILGACADMIVSGDKGIEFCADGLVDDSGSFQNLLEYVPDKMVVIIAPEDRMDMERVCRKWGKQWWQLGIVTEEQKLAVVYKQSYVVDFPVSLLMNFKNAVPQVDITTSHVQMAPKTPVEVPQPEDCKEVARFMLTCPNLLSQQWVFEQFDSTIGTNNLSTNFISDAPVMQIKGSRHAIATSFCNNIYDIEQYPEAAQIVVAEAVRKVVCSGGTPLALTGCLNYSGTSDTEVKKSVLAINENIAFACKKIGVTSSGININHAQLNGSPSINNISLGSIAFLSDKHQHMTISFKGKGDMIYLIGKSTNNLESSEYARSYYDVKGTPPPAIDLDMEARLLHVAQRMIARKLVKSAHSVSQGGLFLALLESAMVRSFGFDITVDDEIRKDAFLFGEQPSRIVVSVAMARETDFIDFMIEAEVQCMTLGHVTREEIRIDDHSYGFISDYKKKYLGIE